MRVRINTNNKLDICRSTRKTATDSLLKTLKKLLEINDPISEVILRDAWLEELRKHQTLFPDGWYLPPPHGIAVLFGTENNPDRLDFKSLRKEENWPKDTIIFNKENGLMFLYTGPLSKEGIMGDFEITLYFGNNKKIIDYLMLHYRLIKNIVEFIKTGMTFKEIFYYSENLFSKHNLVNAIFSVTDPTNKNIGHTYPFITEDMTPEEKKILSSKKWEDACRMLNNKRVFLNSKEEVIVKPGMAFTIEPGVKMRNREDMPFIAFHTVIMMNANGEKEWLTNFDEIFKLVGMDYML